MILFFFLEINFKWALDDGKGILNVKIEEMSIEYHVKLDGVVVYIVHPYFAQFLYFLIE